MLRSYAVASIAIVLCFSAISLATDIPKGTKVTVRLDNLMMSDNVTIGEPFTARLDHDLRFGTDHVMVHKGALVNGVVTDAVSTMNYQRPGKLELRITSITSEGITYGVVSDIVTRVGTPHRYDYKKHRTDDTGARRADITRAGIDVLTGGGGNAPSATVPGGDVTVGGANSQSGMQVILAPNTKITFTVLDAKATIQTKQAF